MSTEIQWTEAKILETLLTDAIAQVRSYDQPPAILAHTIMVAIQTEVGRAKEEVIQSMMVALRGVIP